MRTIYFLIRSILALVLVVSATGCAGLRIYSEVRDKQGAEVKDAWSKVDVTSVIAAERTNLTKLLDAELAAQDKLALGIRDHSLRAIVNSSKVQDGLVSQIDASLEAIAGGNAKLHIQSAENDLSAARTWAKKFSERRDAWNQLRIGSTITECPNLDPANAASVKVFWDTRRSQIDAAVRATQVSRNIALLGGTVLSEAERLCVRKPDEDPFRHFGESALQRANERYLKDVAELTRVKAAAAARAIEYQLAANEYKEAIAAPSASLS